MLDIKRFTEKNYWDTMYSNKRTILSNSKVSQLLSLIGLQDYEYFELIKNNLKKQFSSILEIGCAPGGYLIKAKKRFDLKPFGVEYTKSGVDLTKLNLKKKNIVDYEIFFNDVFDKEFISNNLNRFNVVFSNGFVEHFDNLKDLIDLHKKLTSKGGLLVISIPNLRYLNSFLVSDKTKSIHNLEIMDLDFIRNNLPDGLEIKYLNYCGGLFNVGLFHYKNKFLEIIRSGCFLVQRLIFDPLFILLLKFGISFNWKYSSPAIVLICSKK